VINSRNAIISLSSKGVMPVPSRFRGERAAGILLLFMRAIYEGRASLASCFTSDA